MRIYFIPTIACILIFPGIKLEAQQDHSAYLYTGILYDEYSAPVTNAHVIAEGTGYGDVTDRNGMFQVYIRAYDLLSFYHIALNDTTIAVSAGSESARFVLKRKYHPLPEAKAFPWGASYGEFMQEVKRQGTETQLSEKLELPRRPSGYIPFDKDEKQIKSPGFLLTSPVSYFYYNLSKREKSVRKVYALEKNSEEIERFNELLSQEQLERLTGLSGEPLQDFIIYLNKHMTSTFRDSEIDILTELHAIWDHYREQLLPSGE